ncbi:MAG TPA: aminotransferase class V-fold PLP-dependent enzyme [Steroidobacteraceae bacterium]|jgi:kynureninase|nr:aminotransferase class V-fold PLP-dependent enzyme [Steroidobacteraceae bacterium]
MHRDEFHVPGPGPYVLTHSVGCLPKTSVDAVHASFLRPWQLSGGDAWDPWLAAVESFRECLANLLGGNAADYCPQSNLSSGLAKLLPALPKPDGRAVLLAAEDSFPSLAFVLQRACRTGFDLRFIARGHDPSNAATWAEALTDDVAAVLVTHAHSNTGVVTPVAKIAALCRQRGIRCIVDVAQSAGILPLSVPDCGADIVLGSCVKWLCGGPGAGFMWISPALVQHLAPADVGWFSHADPFEFDVHSFRFAADARRFWGGTPSIAPYAIAAQSMQVIANIGIAAIRAQNIELMNVFRDALPAAWRRGLDLDRIGGTICLNLGDALPGIMSVLRANAVRLDCRGPVLRLSFHVYNTSAEAAFIAGCLAGGLPKCQ